MAFILRLLCFNQTSLEVDGLALKADRRFQELSDTLDRRNSIEDLTAESKVFIRSVGGRVLTKIEKDK